MSPAPRTLTPPNCPGSGTKNPMSVGPTVGPARYEEIACPTCERRFTVRVIRTRHRAPLFTPLAIVPLHRGGA